MKYLTPILALLCASIQFATAAPPAAPPAPQASGRPFQIDGFVAQGYPDGMDGDQHLSYVEYNVTLTPGEGNAWCWAWSHVSDLSIGDVPTGTTCQADDTVTWSFVKTADDYNFTVTWQYTGHGKLIGEWMIPGSQVQWVTDTTGQPVQDYVGPSSFTVSTEDVFGV